MLLVPSILFCLKCDSIEVTTKYSCYYISRTGKKSTIFCQPRRHLQWILKIFEFKAVIWILAWLLFCQELPRLVVSLWGIAGVGKSWAVRASYYASLSNLPELKIYYDYGHYGWVNVPHPFNLWDFSRSLLLDLHSESIQRGTKLRIKDPIQECRDILCEHKCLVVIDGLRSTEEWDLIKASLVFGNSESHVIVITNEESVATYCQHKNTQWSTSKGSKLTQQLSISSKQWYVCS